MKKLITAALTVFALNALAQGDVDQGEMSARVQSAMDAAYSQAKAAQAAQKAGGLISPPSPSVEALRNPARADPMEIAKAYAERNPLNAKKDDLLIFISTSMPKETLKLLGQQAEKVGAILVLRGMTAKLGTPSALQETIKAIEPAASTGATIQIDPEQFQRYDVSVVPAFVIARKQEGCATEQCAAKAYKLVGDVSLDYALEVWVRKGGEVANIASKYLELF